MAIDIIVTELPGTKGTQHKFPCIGLGYLNQRQPPQFSPRDDRHCRDVFGKYLPMMST